MIDETFGEVEYSEDYGFITHKDIEFGGSKSSIEITIACDEEKGAYGPEDEEEFNIWWPDIDTEEEMMKNIHLDSIIVESEYVMEDMGENPIYVLFNRDWGGEDLEGNGVAVLVANGEVAEVGYKDIAF